MPLVVITASGSSVARVASEKGLRLITLSFVPYKIWPNLKALESVIAKLRGLKLIHAWNAKSFELGWYLSKRLRVPLTCTLHDHPASLYFTPRKRWLIKTIAGASSGRVSVSKALSMACQSHGFREPLTTITNGLPQSGSGAKKTRGKNNFRIGFLGMNSTVKGFKLVAEWIKKTASIRHVQWQLYGEVCHDFQPLLMNLQQLGFNNFSVMGRRPTEVIFGEVDLLLHASTAFDCYPTVLLEAARAGIPAVASNCGGAVEIIKHGETGYIFDVDHPEVALEYCLCLSGNDALYCRMASNAKTLFETSFGVAAMKDKYRIFWQTVLKN